MVRWVVGSVQPVLHDLYNKGCRMCYPVCGIMHIKEPLLLIGKSIPCGGSRFPLAILPQSYISLLVGGGEGWGVGGESMHALTCNGDVECRRITYLLWCTFGRLWSSSPCSREWAGWHQQVEVLLSRCENWNRSCYQESARNKKWKNNLE